jgi:predicted nucleic acid-binding protein
MTPILYWDASALLSVLVEDSHSADVRTRLAEEGPHLLSSLTFAEVCAAVARLEREGEITDADRRTALRSLRARPWSALHLEPDPSLVAVLAVCHPLRGASLWHLATAATLARELPDLTLVTFDLRLAEAARGAGLAA